MCICFHSLQCMALEDDSVTCYATRTEWQSAYMCSRGGEGMHKKSLREKKKEEDDEDDEDDDEEDGRRH